MLEKGKPSRVSWGRSGGKVGSMRRTGVGALRARWVGGKSAQADHLQSSEGWKGGHDGWSESFALPSGAWEYL